MTFDGPALDHEPVAEKVIGSREQSRVAPITKVASASPTTSMSNAVPMLATEPAPVYRRSVERGSVRHTGLAPLALSRGTRRVLFRIAVGAATGAIIAIVLTRSPEDVFFVEPELSAGVAGSTRGATPVRSTVARADVRPAAGISAPVGLASLPTPRLADTAAGTALREAAVGS